MKNRPSFTSIDLNSDGMIDSSEFDTYRQSRNHKK